MPHSAAYDAKADCVSLSVQGRVSRDEMRALFAAGARLVLEHDCNRILGDYLRIDAAVKTVDLFQLVELCASEMSARGISAAQVRRALVVPSRITGFAFYENAALERGHRVKLFHDALEAKHWLALQQE